MLTSLSFLERGAQWPPATEANRLDEYATMRELYEGDHATVFAEAFKRLDTEDRPASTYVAALPWPRKVSLTFADLLFGEPSRISTQGGDQKALDEFVKRTSLFRTAHESAFDTGRYGDGLLKLVPGDKCRLKVQPPRYWFPVIDPTDVREVTSHVLAWQYNAGTKQRPDWKLTVEEHQAGQYRTGTANLKGYGKLLNLAADVAWGEWIQTGASVPLVFHAPAWRCSEELFGHADFADGADSILSELEVRVAQACKVLDKHSDPNAYGPDIFDEDPETGESYVKTGNYIELPEDSKVAPGYMTWDGQLSPNFAAIDFLVQQLYAATDTSPALFGKLETGMAESGSALKRLLIAPLARVNRMRLVYESMLRDILTAASEIEGWELGELHFEWRDGLPDDPMESAQVEQTRRAGGITSRRAAIRRLDGLEGQALDDELSEIEREEGTAPTPVPNVTLPETV